MGRKGLDTWVLAGILWGREQLPGCLWDPGGREFPGTHVVVMISSLVLRISSWGLVPSEDSTVGRGETSEQGQVKLTASPQHWLYFFQALLGDPCCARHEPTSCRS